MLISFLANWTPDNFAGGSIPLYPENSKTALDTSVGNELSMTPLEAAFGVAEVGRSRNVGRCV